MAFHNVIIEESKFNEILDNQLNMIVLKGDYQVTLGDNLVIHKYTKPTLFSVHVTEDKVTVTVEQINVVKNRYGKVRYKEAFFSIIKKV